MPKKILIILGNPAQQRQSYGEALALSYKDGAEKAGHDVAYVKISDLQFDPILHEGYKCDQPPEPDILSVQEKMLWAEHWVIIYPLWQFMIPALLKGFLERTLTKGFAYNLGGTPSQTIKLLKGKSVRLIQTMGMPNMAYRIFYRAHAVKALRNMLSFIGISPVRVTYCGMAESQCDKGRQFCLGQAFHLGQSGQ